MFPRPVRSRDEPIVDYQKQAGTPARLSALGCSVSRREKRRAKIDRYASYKVRDVTFHLFRQGHRDRRIPERRLVPRNSTPQLYTFARLSERGNCSCTRDYLLLSLLYSKLYKVIHRRTCDSDLFDALNFTRYGCIRSSWKTFPKFNLQLKSK